MEWDREQYQISRQVSGIGRTDNLRANMLHRGELCVCNNVKWDIGLINGHLRYTVYIVATINVVSQTLKEREETQYHIQTHQQLCVQYVGSGTVFLYNCISENLRTFDRLPFPCSSDIHIMHRFLFSQRRISSISSYLSHSLPYHW